MTDKFDMCFARKMTVIPVGLALLTFSLQCGFKLVLVVVSLTNQSEKIDVYVGGSMESSPEIIFISSYETMKIGMIQSSHFMTNLAENAENKVVLL